MPRLCCGLVKNAPDGECHASTFRSGGKIMRLKQFSKAVPRNVSTVICGAILIQAHVQAFSRRGCSMMGTPG